MQKAIDAKTNTDNSQIIERIKLAYHSALTGGQGSYTKESLEDELEKEFGANNYNVDDSDNTNWILSAKGQSVTVPAGKKGANPVGKLSEEQLRTIIENEAGNCMIDEDGNIIPINVWSYYIISEDNSGICGGSDDDSGDEWNAYNGRILEDGRLEYAIPTFLKVEDKIYKVSRLSDRALLNLGELKSITIPNNITSIDNYVFCGCTGLTSITIPNSVINIGGSAFCDCTKLTNVTIPNSVTSIGNSAFGRMFSFIEHRNPR